MKGFGLEITNIASAHRPKARASHMILSNYKYTLKKFTWEPRKETMARC